MRRLLPAALLILSASPSFAAEGGMPQLDFANPLTISQIVWLVVIFLGLYVTLSRWALPRVGGVIKDRAIRIADDLDGARAAKQAADAAMAAATDAARAARAASQAELNRAIDAAKAAAAANAASLAAARAARLAEAEATIAAARARALASVQDVAASVATAMVTRLAGTAPDPGMVYAEIAGAAARRTG